MVRRTWVGVRDSLWFLPATLVVAGAALAIGLVEAHVAFPSGTFDDVRFLFGAGADGARGMLSTIAGATITVAGVVFSITIVALSIASTQYSPRVLRNFMSDRANQLVLGIFVGIYVYCLVVLRTIRAGDVEFVPSLAVLVAVVLALVGIGFLIFFIHHIASSIQASHIVDAVSSETMRAIDRLFPERVGAGGEEPGDVEAQERWSLIPARKSGYVQDVDGEGLITLAAEWDAVVRMERGVGDYVVADAPLVAVSGDVLLDSDAVEAVGRLFSMGLRRTVDQDAAFGIRQLVDIGLKALSPSVNDTTTALQSIDHLTSVLARLATRRYPERHRYWEGRLRVVAIAPTFARHAEDAIDPLRVAAAGNPDALEGLARLIETVAAQAPVRRRSTLSPHVTALRETARATVEDARGRARVDRSLRRAAAAVARHAGRTIDLTDEARRPQRVGGS